MDNTDANMDDASKTKYGYMLFNQYMACLRPRSI
jgi:hypothetical protein